MKWILFLCAALVFLSGCAAGGKGGQVPDRWECITAMPPAHWELVRDAEAASPSFGERGLALWSPYAAAQWEHLRSLLKNASPQERAQAVNAFFNLVPQVEDRVAWGVEEHWARPVDFVNRGGDCEDYAIAKYYALRSLGVPADDLRIAAVWNRERGEPHALLIARVDEEDLALDNRSPQLRPLRDLPQYGPYYYAVNENGVWRPAPAETLAPGRPLNDPDYAR